MSRLTVLYPTRQRTPDGNVYMVCRCKCGKIVTIARPNRVASCGCLRVENLKAANVNRGEKQWMAKLTVEGVRTIRALRELGYLQREIAADFDVARTTISKVLNRHNWKHVA